MNAIGRRNKEIFVLAVLFNTYKYIRLSSTYAHIKYEDQHWIAINEQTKNQAEKKMKRRMR